MRTRRSWPEGEVELPLASIRSAVAVNPAVERTPPAAAPLTGGPLDDRGLAWQEW